MFLDSRPTSSTITRIHPACQIHPDMNQFGEFIIHCPNHCEESFPPKYEDALKMAVCSARSEAAEPRRMSLPEQVVSGRPSVSSPPPIYTDREVPVDAEHSDSSPTPTTTGSNELPPAYTTASQTLPSIFQPMIRIPSVASSRRDSLTLPSSLLNMPSPTNSAQSTPDAAPTSRSARVSLGEIYAQFPAGPMQLRAASLNSMASQQQQQQPRGRSARPPRVNLPGAVMENEEECSDLEDDVPVETHSPHLATSANSTLRHTASW